MDHSYRIVADAPTATPALGFSDYVDAICDAIREGEPPQFTIGLYGKWGSGKSSLLKAIVANLADDRDVIPVEFDAWRYQRSQQIVIPLLHAVLERVRSTADAPLIESMRRLVRAFGMSLSFRIPVVGGDTSIADIKKAWDESGEAAVALDDAFARPYDELRRAGAALDGKRIVILIDDLDRCTAENMVLVLESINVITDVPGFVFVLALDYDVLVNAVEQRYPSANGHQFIEKIVQLPFRIPRADTASGLDLAEIVPAFAAMSHLRSVADDLVSIVDVVFEGNPRSAKRFINALTLLMRILAARQVTFDPGLLAFVLAGELRWPDEFHDVRTAVAAGDADPIAGIRAAEDDRLQAFLALRTDLITPEALGPILRLTATVSSKAEERIEEEAGSGSGQVARNLPRLLEGIADLGFSLHPRSERVYLHPARPDLRLVLGKLVLRFEVPTTQESGRPWKLATSFRISTEVDDALALAAQYLAGSAVVDAVRVSR